MIIIRRSAANNWTWVFLGTPHKRGARCADGLYQTVAHAWRDAMLWHGSRTPVLIYTR